MQSLLRQRAQPLRAAAFPTSRSGLQAQLRSTRRSFADEAPDAGAPRVTNKAGVFAAMGGVGLLSSYYIYSSNKDAGSGQAEQKEARRKGDPSKEYRDPRDSPIKTLEQKKAREGQK